MIIRANNVFLWHPTAERLLKFCHCHSFHFPNSSSVTFGEARDMHFITRKNLELAVLAFEATDCRKMKAIFLCLPKID